MKLIDIKSCVLHNPIFVGAKNFKERLAANNPTGLKLQYDNTRDALYITWNGETMKLTNNVAGVIPVNPKDMGLETTPVLTRTNPVTHTPSAMTSTTPRTAQVESPHSRIQNPPTPSRLMK